MKNTIHYTLLMLVVVILLPALIVRGCGYAHKKQAPKPHKVESGVTIQVFHHAENEIREQKLEEYVKGVVAAEMPAEFDLEALKAQAVAARTYVFGRVQKIYSKDDQVHPQADICTNSAHCQAWVSKEDAIGKWKDTLASEYWEKLEKAVRETQSIILTYDGKIVNPLFHANSGGKTENAEEVWAGVEVPYLKSVFSIGEDTSKQYENTVEIEIKDFVATLKEEYPEIELNEEDVLGDIEVLEHTTGGRIKDILIGNVTLKGTDFRSLFSLKSANFKIEEGKEDALKITTLGYGHGVGMSQCGANAMAKAGKNYEEILRYYYKGVKLDVVENFIY